MGAVALAWVAGVSKRAREENTTASKCERRGGSEASFTPPTFSPFFALSRRAPWLFFDLPRLEKERKQLLM